MSDQTVQQLFDLTGRTALVTGGAGWLGTAMSQALAEAGASVVVASRDPQRAKTAAESLPTPQGQTHDGIAFDQTSPDSIETGFAKALRCKDRIDVLVNNALDGLGQDLTEVTFGEFAQHQANNAGYFELARRVHDHAVSNQRAASIINVGSMYGQVGSYPDAYEGICNASSVAYHALKGGTLQMTRHLAVYWAADGVRVNSLSPGPFPNPSLAPAALVERLRSHSPLRRMGTPAELKGAIVFLASDASSYVTGQNLTVDGGWTAW